LKRLIDQWKETILQIDELKNASKRLQHWPYPLSYDKRKTESRKSIIINQISMLYECTKFKWFWSGCITFLGYVPKFSLRKKFDSKYIVHVMYIIACKVKSSSEKTFWNALKTEILILWESIWLNSNPISIASVIKSVVKVSL